MCIPDVLVNCLPRLILQSQFVISCLEWVHLHTCKCVCFKCEILCFCRFILTQPEPLIGLRNLICLIYHHSWFFQLCSLFFGLSLMFHINVGLWNEHFLY